MMVGIVVLTCRPYNMNSPPDVCYTNVESPRLWEKNRGRFFFPQKRIPVYKMVYLQKNSFAHISNLRASWITELTLQLLWF